MGVMYRFFTGLVTGLDLIIVGNLRGWHWVSQRWCLLAHLAAFTWWRFPPASRESSGATAERFVSRTPAGTASRGAA